MSTKESVSELPDNILKKELLKKILEKEVDVSNEAYRKSFKFQYRLRSWTQLFYYKKTQKTLNI